MRFQVETSDVVFNQRICIAHSNCQLLGADIYGDWDWTEQDFLSQVAKKRMDLSRRNLASLMEIVEGLF